MKLFSESFGHSEKIPEEFAFGKHDPQKHCILSQNKNPHLAWRDLPKGTKSLVLICHDDVVPSEATNVNQEGKTVPASLPRVDFYHWVLVDLKPEPSSIKAGEFSDGITARGKNGPNGPRGTRQGINDYTQWFSGDPEMSGAYYGYDGPCPPWNDELIHRYHFTLYALALPRCPVEGKFTGPQVLKAIKGRVLGQTFLTGLYAINPKANAR